jgi:AAA domain-containing protein
MNKGKKLRYPRLDAERLWKGISWLDFSKIKNPRPLIDNFLMEGTTQLCYGKFGTRKTTIHLKAAWSVSQGIPFLGMKTRQRAVLYLDYENPAGVLKQYCDDLGIDSSGPMFKIFDRAAGPPPKPGDPKLNQFIHNCKKITGRRPWIIFDSWTSLLRVGASGNEIGDITKIFRAIREYCDKGVTCTIIDHTGKKGGKDPIGSSAKMSQMDTAHLITIKTNKDISGKSSVSTVRVENFLKRFAPEGVGTFSIEIKAALNEKGHWHTTSIQPTKDRSVRRDEKRVSAMQYLISKNPTKGKEDLVKKAVKAKLESRDDARRLLEEGTGTFWKLVTKKNSNKQVFRVLRSSISK